VGKLWKSGAEAGDGGTQHLVFEDWPGPVRTGRRMCLDEGDYPLNKYMIYKDLNRHQGVDKILDTVRHDA
jgi:hypothetical protein